MSIILEGIDLPKNKDEYMVIRIYGNGRTWENKTLVGLAIQIPTPHGRLIDGDWLKEKRETFCWREPNYTPHESDFIDSRHIDNAPTILEEEK